MGESGQDTDQGHAGVSDMTFGTTASSNNDEPSKAEYRAGKLCPRCRQGILDYDGLLNLVCPVCGPMQAGCFT